MFLFKLVVILLGLTLPGFLLARAFRLEHAWAAAFPFSALCMVETVIFFAMTGIPLRFSTVTIALLLCAGCALIVKTLWRPAEAESAATRESSGLPPRLVAVILAIAIVLVAIVTLRTALFPLRGLDTSFRWEGLARAMLEHQSLDFYPPVSAGDYSIYLFPDGIPPLVATVYWWIYATLGTPIPQATSVSIALQLAATMALTFYGTRHAFGARAAWSALLALCASPLLINSFAIGQETGFTALAVAGQLCFAWATVRNPKVSTVVVAALFAALGGLARDYGPALALSGFAVLAWHRPTRRYLGIFTLTTILLTAPWYLRSWALTGNPFFSHRLPGGFSINPTHAAIIDFYKEVYSFSRFDAGRWLTLAKQLATGGFLAICVGLPYALGRWREAMPLLITAALVTLLWIFSVPQTAGGVIYSTRVLTPALIALAMAAGAAGAHLYETRAGGRLAFAAAMIGFAACALVSAAAYPLPATALFATNTASASGSIQQIMVNRLEKSDFPATGVLTDAPFFAAVLKQNSRFRPVMCWSPEVAFLFTERLTPAEMQGRLREMNIRLVFVDDQSTTNPFLWRYRFFRESDDWQLLLEEQNEGAFYSLAPR